MGGYHAAKDRYGVMAAGAPFRDMAIEAGEARFDAGLIGSSSPPAARE